MAKRTYTKSQIKKLYELFEQRLTVAECARRLSMPESTVRDHLVRWQKRPEVAMLSLAEHLDARSCVQRARQASWYTLLQRIMKGEVATRELCRLVLDLEHSAQHDEPFLFGEWLRELLPLDVLPDKFLKRMSDGEPFHVVALDAVRESYEYVRELRKQDDVKFLAQRRS